MPVLFGCIGMIVPSLKYQFLLLFTVLSVLLFGLPRCVHAAHYGLIVGVGQFQHHSKLNLAGVARDVEMMTDVFLHKGITHNRLTILQDQDATLELVVNAFKTLATTTGAADTVSIYFSTHGSQIADLNGDEIHDQYDEFLAMHDLKIEQRNGGMVPVGGVLLDDELQHLLNDIPAKKLLILDACASATAHKSPVNLRDGFFAVYKYLRGYWSGPGNNTGESSAELFDLQQSNLLVISASQDSQLAGSDATGSVFTRALHVTATRQPQTPFCWYVNAFAMTAQQSRFAQQPGFEGGWLAANSLWPATQSAGAMAAIANLHHCFNTNRETDTVQLNPGTQQIELSLSGSNAVQVYALATGSNTITPLVAQRRRSPQEAVFSVGGFKSTDAALLVIAYHADNQLPEYLFAGAGRWALWLARNQSSLEVLKVDLQVTRNP